MGILITSVPEPPCFVRYSHIWNTRRQCLLALVGNVLDKNLVSTASYLREEKKFIKLKRRNIYIEIHIFYSIGHYIHFDNLCASYWSFYAKVNFTFSFVKCCLIRRPHMQFHVSSIFIEYQWHWSNSGNM